MRLLAIILLLQILQGSADAQNLPEIAKCPDFTGTFDYPGPQSDACAHTSAFGFGKLVLPALTKRSGGYQRMFKAGELRIRQSGCAHITFSATIATHARRPAPGVGVDLNDPNNYYYSDWSGTIDLLPPEKGEERYPPTVEWAEKSLTFRSRFVAEGFGAGWGYNAMLFTLEWKDEDTLLYSFRHEKGRRGKKFMDIHCELERVADEDEAMSE